MSTSIVVVPCYNEAERLDVKAFANFASANPDVRLMFVDDGSTDQTLELLRDLNRTNPEQLLVQPLARNVGKAEAVRSGLLAACAMEPDYVGFWDADLATPLEDVRVFAALLDERAELQMVFGSRVRLLGRSIGRRAVRHFMGRVFATAASNALGLAIYDTQCGAKLFRVTPGFVGRLQQPFIGGWIFDVEIIAREVQARRSGNLPPVQNVIYEHPLMVWNDVPGSKVRLRDWFVVGTTLVRIYWRYLRSGRSQTRLQDNSPTVRQVRG